MAARRDDSMLFSLNGLLGADRERVERELRQHRLAAQAAWNRAEARRRAEREAELERLREASEAARQEAQRRKEEEIRLAAVAQGEALAQARIELLEKHHEHERRMAELKGQGQRGTQLAVAGLSVALLCVAGSLGVYFGKLRPDTLRMQKAYEDLVSAERNRAVETKRLLERTEKRRAELAAELEQIRLETPPK